MIQVAFDALTLTDEGVYHMNYVTDNETIGHYGLPQMFEVPGLGNGMYFYPVRSEFDGNRITYKQMLGCIGITIWRM